MPDKFSGDIDRRGGFLDYLVIILITIILVTFVVWANFTKLDLVTTGSGRLMSEAAPLVPSGDFELAILKQTEISFASNPTPRVTNNLLIRLAKSPFGGDPDGIQLENGEIDILIGTHALIEDKVVFQNLAFAVIDEQHRFGVAQRAKLWKKNKFPCLTAKLNANYVGPAVKGSWVYGYAELTRATKSIIFMKCQLFIDQNIIFNSDGIFKILTNRGKKDPS